MRRFRVLTLFCCGVLITQTAFPQQEQIPAPTPEMYGFGSWDSDSLGNHRAVVHVGHPADGVIATLPWRRKDPNAGSRDIMVVDATTGEEIADVMLLPSNSEVGRVVFRPVTTPGDYYIYFLLYSREGSRYYPRYVPKTWEAPSSEWSQRISRGNLAGYPAAAFVRFEAVEPFHTFYPMEVVATTGETASLLDRYQREPFLVFPEDAFHPIRLTDQIPFRWTENGPFAPLSLESDRGTFVSFQIGVWAAKSDLEGVVVRISDWFGDGSGPESWKSVCLNNEGVDYTGRPFTTRLSIPAGRIQPIWCGVEIPDSAKPGRYRASASISTNSEFTRSVSLFLTVNTELAVNHGDNDPSSMSRIRWFNSTIAIDDEPIERYTPVQVDGHRISILGRELFVGPDGLPSRIRSFFSPDVTHIRNRARDVLTSPFTLAIQSSGQSLPEPVFEPFEIHRKSDAVAEWQTAGRVGPLETTLSARLEHEGYVSFDLAVSTRESIDLDDIRLDVPLDSSAARYVMGLGKKGGFRPENIDWKWSVEKNQDALWIGDVNAGMQLIFRDEHYQRPLNTNFYHQRPLRMPASWANNGNGGITIREADPGTALVSAYSGKRILQPGDTLHYVFNVHLTPFHPLPTQGHLSTRFVHRYVPVDTVLALGGNTVNIHHANEINPYINYPFLRVPEMKAYMDEAHEKGVRAKIYYTVREIANRAAELDFMQSLGSEIISEGDGGGYSWLQEHLAGNYIAGWFVPDLEDAAVVVNGLSRLQNYYVEGLDWLAVNVGIDGLYLDDVAFDRTTMKRIRKILDKRRPGAVVDLHSANQHNTRDGFSNSANLYLEHFPYLDRLWFGEYFDYSAEPPDFWLVEVSGIPFGLMGEMLEKCGLPFRGLLYGMTTRVYGSCNPKEVWNVMDGFGVAESQMTGYWSPGVPVTTNHSDVLSTVFARPDRALVVLASWSPEMQNIRLNIDWNLLGFDPNTAWIEQPAAGDLQTAGRYAPSDTIRLAPAGGRFLILHKN